MVLYYEHDFAFSWNKSDLFKSAFIEQKKMTKKTM